MESRNGADTVIMKNGAVRKGDIYFECPTYIVMVNPAGRDVTIMRSRIAEIRR